MSLLPILLDDILQEQERTRHRLRDIYDPLRFGLSLFDDDHYHRHRSRLMPRLRHGVCPWRHLVTAAGAGDNMRVASSKDGFKVNLDVQQFKPEEIKVKVVDDFLVVEANHNERSDQHGFISRQFTRRYKLPKDIDSKALVSKLSSDGVLTLEAPKLDAGNFNVREIPITHTNTPVLKQQHPNSDTAAELMPTEN